MKVEIDQFGDARRTPDDANYHVIIERGWSMSGQHITATITKRDAQEWAAEARKYATRGGCDVCTAD